MRPTLPLDEHDNLFKQIEIPKIEPNTIINRQPLMLLRQHAQQYPPAPPWSQSASHAARAHSPSWAALIGTR